LPKGPNDLNIERKNFALWKFADDTTLSEIILKQQPSMRFYCSCIRSIMEYSCQVFNSGLPSYLSNEIEKIKKRANE